MRSVVIFVFTVLLSISAGAAKDKIIVVIDPGHGGTDHGHVSSDKDHMPEKELNLIIAKKFGDMIEKQLQNVSIIYSRTDDTYPSLGDRVKLANSSKADYFISIHCNANAKKSVHGTESHVHTMEAKKSVGLAQAFEKEFTSFAGRYSRGVKDTEDREHSLQVLKYTTMTGVLIECGFMTNDDEAVFLNTASGQEKIATSIFRAFKSYIVKQHPAIAFVKEEPKKETAEQKTEKPTDATKSYAIQIMSSKQPVETSVPEFKKIELPVSRNEIQTTSAFKYRYTVGQYASQDDAQKDLEKVQQNGFKDAYIVKLN
jgi:N-acetylmuramoyl-L-alanine amidase